MKGVRSGHAGAHRPPERPQDPVRSDAGWDAPFPERESGCAESPGSDARQGPTPCRSRDEPWPPSTRAEPPRLPSRRGHPDPTHTPITAARRRAPRPVRLGVPASARPPRPVRLGLSAHGPASAHHHLSTASPSARRQDTSPPRCLLDMSPPPDSSTKSVSAHPLRWHAHASPRTVRALAAPPRSGPSGVRPPPTTYTEGGSAHPPRAAGGCITPDGEGLGVPATQRSFRRCDPPPTAYEEPLRGPLGWPAAARSPPCRRDGGVERLSRLTRATAEVGWAHWPPGRLPTSRSGGKRADRPRPRIRLVPFLGDRSGARNSALRSRRFLFGYEPPSLPPSLDLVPIRVVRDAPGRVRVVPPDPGQPRVPRQPDGATVLGRWVRALSRAGPSHSRPPSARPTTPRTGRPRAPRRNRSRPGLFDLRPENPPVGPGLRAQLGKAVERACGPGGTCPVGAGAYGRAGQARTPTHALRRVPHRPLRGRTGRSHSPRPSSRQPALPGAGRSHAPRPSPDVVALAPATGDGPDHTPDRPPTRSPAVPGHGRPHPDHR
jgi:hypothetical protein